MAKIREEGKPVRGRYCKKANTNQSGLVFRLCLHGQPWVIQNRCANQCSVREVIVTCHFCSHRCQLCVWTVFESKIMACRINMGGLALRVFPKPRSSQRFSFDPAFAGLGGLKARGVRVHVRVGFPDGTQNGRTHYKSSWFLKRKSARAWFSKIAPEISWNLYNEPGAYKVCPGDWLQRMSPKVSTLLWVLVKFNDFEYLGLRMV